MRYREWDISKIASFRNDHPLMANINISNKVAQAYAQPHRKYHNIIHMFTVLNDVMIQFPKNNDTQKAHILAAIYHDVVYDPYAKDNEEKSVEFMMNDNWNCEVGYIQNTHWTYNLAKKLILETKDLSKDTPFNRIDRKILLQGTFKELVEYGRKIWTEYSKYDWDDFLDGHSKIVRQIGKGNYEEVGLYLEYLQTQRPTIAIYAGSFNPFHIGHYSIAKEAEKIFDKVIICRAINPEKFNPGDTNIEGADEWQCINSYGLLSELYQEYSKKGYEVTFIKGLRNGSDFEYEKVQNRFLKDFNPSMKIVYIASEANYEHVSSSAIRSIQKFDQEKAKKYLP